MDVGTAEGFPSRQRSVNEWEGHGGPSRGWGALPQQLPGTSRQTAKRSLKRRGPPPPVGPRPGKVSIVQVLSLRVRGNERK